MNFGEPASLGQALGLLAPELVLFVTGLFILGADAVLRDREDKSWIPWAALIGLAVALVAALVLWGNQGRVLAVLALDYFALAVKMVVLLAMMLVVLASDAYMQAHTRHLGEFYAMLLFVAMAICLLGMATNLVMIFLAFDFVSITSYILTGYLRDDERSTEAAIKYFLYGAAVSAMMLYGMSWFYGLTGSVDLKEIGVLLTGAGLAGMEATLRPVALIALVMMAAGFAFKIGAAPFHQWAPDAYEGAPTPVTAFLSVGPKIGGFAVILRVLLTALPPSGLVLLGMDWRALLMAISALTMLVGNLVALWQTNIKRMLAYSSIAHAGYMLIGVVAASPQGTMAVLLYLAAYALTNLGAFAAVIAFSNRIGSDEIEDYAGLSTRAPGLAMGLLICLLSLGGIPPTAGFVGKLWLFAAAIKAGLLWLAAVGVVNSVISLAYYWKVIRAMYLTPAQAEERVGLSPALAVGLTVAVVGVFVIGMAPAPFVTWFQTAAQALFAG